MKISPRSVYHPPLTLYSYLFPRFHEDIHGRFVLDRWNFFLQTFPVIKLEAIIPTPFKFRKRKQPPTSFPVERVWIIPSRPRFLMFASIPFYFFLILIKFLKEKPKNVILDYGYPDAFFIFCLSKLLQFRYIIVLRGTDVNIFAEKSSILTKLTLLGYKNASMLLPVSEDLKKILVGNGCKKELILTVHNSFNPIWREKQQFRIKEYTQTKIMTMVGRFSVEKRQDLLIECFKHLNEKFDNLRLILVSDGPKLRYCKKLAMNIPNITFTGVIRTKKLIEIISNSTIIVHLSEREGLPTILLEAMALGTPIVASKIGGICELIGNRSGVLVNNEKEEIINACTILLNNLLLRKRLSNNAMSRIKLFSPETVTKKLKLVLDKIGFLESEPKTE